MNDVDDDLKIYLQISIVSDFMRFQSVITKRLN